MSAKGIGPSDSFNINAISAKEKLHVDNSRAAQKAIAEKGPGAIFKGDSFTAASKGGRQLGEDLGRVTLASNSALKKNTQSTGSVRARALLARGLHAAADRVDTAA